MYDDNPKIYRQDWRCICSILGGSFALLLFGFGAAEVRLSAEEGEPADSSHLMKSYFEDVGLTEGDWNSLQEGARLGNDENEVLYPLLYRLPTISLVQLGKLASYDPAWEEMEANPALHRAEVIHLKGTLLALERLAVSEDRKEALEFDQFYRVRIALDDSGRLVDVYCRSVPKIWLSSNDEDISDEPVSATALFLKRGETSESQPVLVLAASRVAWHPVQIHPALRVNAGVSLLAKQGMDIGLFDTIQQKSNVAINYEDRECFFQMLNAVRKSEPPIEQARRITDSDLNALVYQPDAQKGELITLKGIAREIYYIPAPEDIQKRLGITHYYQISFLYYLKEGVVTYEGVEDGKDRMMSHLPFMFYCLELPEGMPQGSNVREPIKIRGYYFKVHSYRSELTRNSNSNLKQQAPLIIGRRLIWTPPKTDDLGGNNLLIGILFTTAILGLWLLWWLFNRSDRGYMRSTIDRQLSPPEGVSLDSIGLDSEPMPDRDDVRNETCNDARDDTDHKDTE